MILVDTSVWVDHLCQGDSQLVELLEANAVIMHPYIVGEIACSNLANRATTLNLLQLLPAATVAEFSEVLGYIERYKLHGKGIGYVDAHLLASAVLDGAKLWTRDKKLQVATRDLGYAFADQHASK